MWNIGRALTPLLSHWHLIINIISLISISLKPSSILQHQEPLLISHSLAVIATATISMAPIYKCSLMRRISEFNSHLEQSSFDGKAPVGLSQRSRGYLYMPTYFVNNVLRFYQLIFVFFRHMLLNLFYLYTSCKSE
ncbi:hypothetical protein DFH27DRAFT_192300 [Peziza echinospora]|nr:hypothetical protein DFH27DRAFT_192300 [Peziza echinospora]